MENIKLNGTIKNSSTLNAQISTTDSVEGSVGRGVIAVSIKDHNRLDNRDLPNQHPIDAIEGLKDELLSIKKGQETTTMSIKTLSTKIDNKIRSAKFIPSDMQKGEFIFLEKEEIING
jgi:hypothetical protein